WRGNGASERSPGGGRSGSFDYGRGASCRLDGLRRGRLPGGRSPRFRSRRIDAGRQHRWCDFDGLDGIWPTECFVRTLKDFEFFNQVVGDRLHARHGQSTREQPELELINVAFDRYVQRTAVIRNRERKIV